MACIASLDPGRVHHLTFHGSSRSFWRGKSLPKLLALLKLDHFSEAEIQTNRKRVHGKWRARGDQQFLDHNFEESDDDYGAVVAAFPELPDLAEIKLMQARLQMVSGDSPV